MKERTDTVVSEAAMVAGLVHIANRPLPRHARDPVTAPLWFDALFGP